MGKKSVPQMLLGSLKEDKRVLNSYLRIISDTKIQNRAILLEPQQGRSLCGNIYYVAQYLMNSEKYDEYDKYIVVQRGKENAFAALMETAGMTGHFKVIVRNSAEYIRLLATCKYLITDTSFPTYFIKRDGQVIWNLWHGTPLKALGRKDHSGVVTLGNIQKNLGLADYLSFPNEFTANHMINDYMLDKIYNGTIVLDGYPRNTVFFDDMLADYPLNIDEVGDVIPDEDENKRRYAYLPTWRPLPNGYPKRYRSIELIYHLIQLDKVLRDDEVLFVNLHPLDGQNVVFKCFKHIKAFPTNVETYAFLRTCDALVTDYSSVFFDFAPTRKPIVLFCYDEKEYLHDRGMYLSMDDLPFKRVSTVDALVNELRSNSYLDTPEWQKRFDEFINKFCKYEHRDATAEMCDRIILGEDTAASCVEHHDNGKENVIIYAGNMARNGITTSLLSLLANIGDDGRNYFVAFQNEKAKRNAAVVDALPEWVQYIPFMGKTNMSLFQKSTQYLYGKTNVGLSLFTSACDDAYRENFKRCFGFLPSISALIQFNGYDFKIIEWFSSLDMVKRIIFMHNDMIQEARLKGNSRLPMLKYAYGKYDSVAVVSDDLVDIAKQINNDADVHVVPNLFDYQRINDMSEQPMRFSESETQSTVSLEELKAVLNDENIKVIVSIGRFSPEKEHIRLYDAFSDVERETDGDVRLLVIGGGSYSDKFNVECNYVSEHGLSDKVMLVKNLDNPYSFLKKCDGLILPSSYEGFGLVLLEADTLGVPVVATNIVGPSTFMKKHGGCLVENSLDGVKDGLRKLIAGSVSPLGVDYRKYNSEAIAAFEKMLADVEQE